MSESKTFLTAEWRKLMMAQYEVRAEVLAPWVPGGVEVDLFEGRCFVSVVGFMFDKVRIKGVAIPWHTRFEEVNLRFYVKRVMADGSERRGVVFLSEIVPKPAITLVARTLYGEAYSTERMRHAWKTEGDALRVEYEWRHRGEWQRMSVEAEARARAIAPGSVEEFLTEHYWGYTKRRGGATGEYGVEHPRWECYAVRGAEVRADMGSLYGPAFAGLTGSEPASVLLAEGSKVAVRVGEKFRKQEVGSRK